MSRLCCLGVGYLLARTIRTRASRLAAVGYTQGTIRVWGEVGVEWLGIIGRCFGTGPK
jgi:hypothetical protein